MAPRSMKVAFLASQIAALLCLPAVDALSSACSVGAFDEDEGQCTLSLLQVHTELTRRSRSQPSTGAQEQVAFAARSIKTTAVASGLVSRSLTDVRSSLATLAALNVPAAKIGKPELQAMGPAGVDDLVADINQKIDDASRLLKAKIEAGARSSLAVDALRASMSGLATAPAGVSAQENLDIPRATLDHLGAHNLEAIRQLKEPWRPNSNSDPRSDWGTEAEAQNVDKRYSRLQPENQGAPEIPESYEALGSDAESDHKSAKVKKVKEVEGGDEPAEEEASSHGGLFAPSEAQEQVHSSHTRKHSGKQAAAKSAIIRDAFDLFDADDSSAVDLHELRTGLKFLGFETKYGQPHKMLVDMDTDHNGAIDYPEFSKMMLDHHLLGSS